MALIVLVVGLKTIQTGSLRHGIAATVRQPQTVINDKFELKEGTSKSWSFHLTDPATVDLALEAEEKPVNVYLFTADQWGQFSSAMAQPLGRGRFNYNQALSQESTMRLQKTANLPEGDWHIAVMRPREAILFTHSAVADLKVVVR